ncbi:MAG TPA: glycosyltransferase family A protein [Terriglobales bacterium]|nr:glycosyltransferase family A protein [Terriglobales bacterium]
MSRLAFTISTQSYNRKHQLPRVYDSLKAQTFRDFEWVIVDDGSSDGTEELVKAWQRESDFPIRYFYQQNRGKHVGFNWAVREAQGELLLSFDSDDSCVPTALERFKYHWDAIPDKENYSTLCALCMDDRGNLIGPKYPKDVVDAESFQEQYRYRAFERWGVNRTDILRQYPFPEVGEERYAPEALVWNRLSMRYKARFVNEVLRIYHYEPGDVVPAMDKRKLKSPRIARIYYSELSGMPVPAWQKVRATINYIRWSLHAQSSIGDVIGDTNHRLLAVSLLPAGFLVYQRDLTRQRRNQLS